MKRILVTGGTGYIGSTLVKQLYNEGFDIFLVTRSPAHSKFNYLPNDNIYVHDGSTSKLVGIVSSIKPDLIIHLAAFFTPQHQLEDLEPLILSNLLFGTQLLEAMSQGGVKYLINTGTHWQHYEGESYNPVNLYAATKQAFETLAKYYQEKDKVRILTIKLIDTYGPFDPRPKVLSLLKKLALSDGVLDMSPGDQELGLLYIDDVIEAYMIGLTMVKELQPGENLRVVAAPKVSHSLKQVVETFETVIGKKLNIRWGDRPYREREMMKVWRGDRNILEEVETTDLCQGIKKMLDTEMRVED